MDTITSPPTIPGAQPGKIYPTSTSRIGRAWALAWIELTNQADLAAGWLDGTELATLVARKVAPKLTPVTMTQLFARMARAGVLLEEKRSTVGTRGIRKRSFYRVPCPECAEYAGTGGEAIACATCGKPGL